MVRSLCIPVRLILLFLPFPSFSFSLPFSFLDFFLFLTSLSFSIVFFLIIIFCFPFSFHFYFHFIFILYFYFYFSSYFSYPSAFLCLSSFSFLFEWMILSIQAEQGQTNFKWHQEYSKSPHYYFEKLPKSAQVPVIIPIIYLLA